MLFHRLAARWFVGLLLHLSLCGDWCTGLRGLRMEVPEAVLTGEAARLLCDYDLEQAALYSIKWYRGDEEFYRFVPKESPPTRVFPLPGIHVDISLSDARRVTLLDVSKQLTGFYKCEVSADAPLFHTEIKSATMTVVEVPEDEPEIVADRPRYSAGETIQANCSSGAAFPAPNITWFLNDQRVPVGMGNLDLPGIPVVDTTVTEVGGGLETARSTLQLHTAGLGGRLRLRCEATLFTLYRRSSKEVTLPEVTPQTASVLGPSRAAAAGSESMVVPAERSLGMVLLVLMCSILVTSCR